MLSTRQIVLSNFDVDSKLSVEDCADPNDDQDGHEQVSAIAARICRLHIAPSQRIQTSDSAGSIARFVAGIDVLSSAVDVIEWDKSRQHNEANRNEDHQQSPQVSQEEVGIETALLNDFTIGEFEQVLDQSNQSRRRARSSFAFGDEVSFGFARRV